MQVACLHCGAPTSAGNAPSEKPVCGANHKPMTDFRKWYVRSAAYRVGQTPIRVKRPRLRVRPPRVHPNKSGGGNRFVSCPAKRSISKRKKIFRFAQNGIPGRSRPTIRDAPVRDALSNRSLVSCGLISKMNKCGISRWSVGFREAGWMQGHASKGKTRRHP